MPILFSSPVMEINKGDVRLCLLNIQCKCGRSMAKNLCPNIVCVYLSHIFPQLLLIVTLVPKLTNLD